MGETLFECSWIQASPNLRFKRKAETIIDRKQQGKVII